MVCTQDPKNKISKTAVASMGHTNEAVRCILDDNFVGDVVCVVLLDTESLCTLAISNIVRRNKLETTHCKLNFVPQLWYVVITP